MIRAEDWNAAALRLRRAWPIAGENCRVTEVEGGVVVEGDASVRWPHPWSVRVLPTFDEAGKFTWRASVRPGFCNARDVIVDVDGTDRLLTDDPPPQIPLTDWRDATAGADVPPYLQALNTFALDEYIGTAGVESARVRPRRRQLRALDLVLVQPREAMKLLADPGEPLAGQPTAQLQFAYSSQRDEPARLVVLRSFDPIGSETAGDIAALYDVLLRAADPPADRLKIATIWMLSPPDVAATASPDETWTPYVQHFVFWNLWHEAQNPPRAITPDNPPEIALLPLATLAGGSLTSLILFSISQSASVQEIARAFLQRNNRAGKFWTT